MKRERRCERGWGGNLEREWRGWCRVVGLRGSCVVFGRIRGGRGEEGMILYFVVCVCVCVCVWKKNNQLI